MKGANQGDKRVRGVVLIAALDTKGVEAAYLCDRVAEAGFEPLLIDVGVLGRVMPTATVTREQVAERGGTPLAELRRRGERAAALDVMLLGAQRWTRDLWAEGRVAGVLAIGGSGGTAIGTAAMRALPLGVPKVMVSTLASGDVRPYVDTKDICMIHSVADFCGLNPVLEPILAGAAAAVCSMAAVAEGRLRDAAPGQHRPLVSATMFGVTTPCVERARKTLTERGFDLVPFHATGVGGRAMEELIAEGLFDAVLDLTTTEWADEVVGGSLGAGPHRLDAAARGGLPQVLAPGALDMVNFVGPAGLPERFAGRRVHRHNDNVLLMRTNADECSRIGRRMAERLDRVTAPTTLLFPRRGLSALDIEGGPFFDPEADAALLEAFERHCLPPIEVVAVDLHLNDPGFADACCEALLANMADHDTRRRHHAQGNPHNR